MRRWLTDGYAGAIMFFPALPIFLFTNIFFFIIPKILLISKHKNCFWLKRLDPLGIIF